MIEGNAISLDVPTQNQQRFALMMYYLGSLSFSDQKIYTTKKYFKKEMAKLVEFGKVEVCARINGDMRKKCEVYSLNPAGKIWVEFAIIKYQERIK